MKRKAPAVDISAGVRYNIDNKRRCDKRLALCDKRFRSKT